MKKQIKNLFHFAELDTKIILGLMSGTSLDGLDIALCKISGNGINTTCELLQFETIPYSNELKNELKTIFCKEEVSLEKVCVLNNFIGKHHAQLINQCLQKWNIKNEEVDLVASHGQTIYHAPKHKHPNSCYDNATLQIGDADQIAVNTGIITISDFRQKHIAAGGEGAPLAVYGDYFLLSSEDENRILLNIGGISNFTFLPKNLNFAEVICTDIGPGNTLMDAYIQQHFEGLQFDENAAIALQGKVNDDLLNALMVHDFFQQNFPKSTGQEIFNLNFIEDALAKTKGISEEDVLATLSLFTAKTIANAIQQNIFEQDFTIYTSGGGIHNPLLMLNLQNELPNIKIESTATLGINPNAKEAILFAVLANECISGDSEFYTSNHKNIPIITMGKISLPN
ncbi:MAG: anhydro-N-acetylmuramic acid kinase [Chitinophagaceae bacterium]|nr:anhydro-N-acetylmuramic acid kinase [Chitinophagaceae bacterium]